MGLTEGVTIQQTVLTPARHLILPLHLSEVHVALHSNNLYCFLDYDYVSHIANFAILYLISKLTNKNKVN
jgi:hypothetical protein